jgi:hypothetical protein
MTFIANARVKGATNEDGTVSPPGPLLAVLGFVGSEGPVRAVCVDPVSGVAQAHYLYNLIFEFPNEKPLKEVKNGKHR